MKVHLVCGWELCQGTFEYSDEHGLALSVKEVKELIDQFYEEHHHDDDGGSGVKDDLQLVGGPNAN